MNAKVEEKEFQLDGLKWILVIGMVIGAAVLNSYYSDQFDLIYRVIALLVVGGVAAFIAVNTAKGDSFWSLLKAAQVEVRKVVWPSREETTRTALVVIAFTIFMAFVLWGLDTGLGFVASKIIG